MSLSNLPTELLQIIVNFCGPDLSGLARTNKRLHNITNPILWRLGIDDAESFTEMTARAAAAGNLQMLKRAAFFGADLHVIHPVPMLDEMRYETSLCQFSEEEYKYVNWAAPLHLAVYHGFYEMVDWLISHGVDIETPGHLLCRCKGIEDYEKEPFIENHPCWTSLHFAICRNQDAIARLLLREGASTDTMIDIRDIDFDRIVNQSLQQRVDQLVEFDWHCTCNCGSGSVTALHTASELGQRSLVEHMVRDRQVDINKPDSDGCTAIFYAMLSSDQGMIAHLANLGADLNYGGRNRWANLTETPLGWAMMKGLYKSAGHLLELGASTWYGEPGRRKSSLISGRFVDHYGLSWGSYSGEDNFPSHWGHLESPQLFHNGPQEKANAIVKVLRHAIMSYESDEDEHKSLRTQIQSAIADFILDRITKTKHLKELFNCQYPFNNDELVALGFEALNRLVMSICWSPQPEKIWFLLHLGVNPRNGNVSCLHELLVSLQKVLKRFGNYRPYYREIHVTRMVDLVTYLTEHEQWDSVSKADMAALCSICVKVLETDWGRFKFLKQQLRDSLDENLPQELQLTIVRGISWQR
ncbi:hypothetical protein CkaCkLH20_11046 [Colletotrichum karsti]|uniref:F-box domain-containing protein n=1 Tax=Colletotrichum karsti TaxID=1095194 RepID=A0A9P6HVT4_9PEZI|nr:uncharacterized protein CkaCkLH20_11046 [Colletotrichum karsti]KAF9871399.1 hypothetical protein CkaCkLH20_11046 [Colletotrichum karsti]